MSTIKAQDKVENEQAEDDVSLPTTPVEELKAPEEVEESEAESTEEAEEETTETEEKVQKKGFSNRIRELVKEKKDAQRQAKSLQEKLAELTGQGDQQSEYRQYEPTVEPGSEISPEQYKDDVMKAADALVTLRVKQSEAVNRINNEATEVIRNYPELDPESDDFNKELSETVTEATESYVRANPYTASVKSFVAKLMKPYKGAVAKEVGKANEQIAKQASEAALKPTSMRKGEKTAAEKTIAELEQELGVVVS